MAIAESKLTAQGQTSVPAEIRRRLGVGAGSTLEWDEEDDKIVVRRAAKYTWDDIHRVLFKGKKPPKHHTVEEMDDGIRRYIRKKYARR
jgi:AbrB family looped-hinge helix DNA binding protein